MHRHRSPARAAWPPARPATSALALCVSLALALSACGGGDDDPDSGASPSGETSTASDGASVEAEPYLPVPDGVQLTAQGSELSLGDSATLAWRPRTTTTGVIDVTVRSVERAPLSVFSGFRLDKATRASSAYFVRVRITNIGENDLSGAQIPLYLVDGRNTLIQASTFASRFAPCPSMPFPRGFEPEQKVATCLVFLAPDKGEAEAVSFRPSQAFNPITWTGPTTRYRPGGTKNQGNEKQGGQEQQ